MASISDPKDIAELFGVAHEPFDLSGGDTEARPRPRVVEEGALAPRVPEEGALAPVSKGSKPRRSGGRSSRSRRPEPVEGSRRREQPTDLDERDPGPEADPESVGRKILLDQLTGRARSRSDLAKKLAERGVPDEIAENLLDRFEAVGLVDDAAFARDWVSQRQEGRGLARRALAHELRRKGIDDEVAREALETVDADDEVDAARLLVQRKLRSVRGLEQQVAVRRLVGMLARKGYSSGVSFKVVREELTSTGSAQATLDLVDPEHSGL